MEPIHSDVCTQPAWSIEVSTTLGEVWEKGDYIMMHQKENTKRNKRQPYYCGNVVDSGHVSKKTSSNQRKYIFSNIIYPPTHSTTRMYFWCPKNAIVSRCLWKKRTGGNFAAISSKASCREAIEDTKTSEPRYDLQMARILAEAREKAQQEVGRNKSLPSLLSWLRGREVFLQNDWTR